MLGNKIGTITYQDFDSNRVVYHHERRQLKYTLWIGKECVGFFGTLEGALHRMRVQ